MRERRPDVDEIRRTAPWAGVWVDLLDDLDGAKVLLIDPGPGRAAAALVARGAHLAIAEDDQVRVDDRRALLPNVGAARLAPEAELLRERWDVVVVEGEPGTATKLRGRASALERGGRLVVITDNRVSALRALDRARGNRGGIASVTGLAQLRRRLHAAGLRPHQVFGLLRSSLVPVTAFDLDARHASRAVLYAAATHISGLRRAGLVLLADLAGRRGGAGVLAPAWLVVAVPTGDQRPLDPARLTARLGYERTHVIKLLRGEPPTSVEKRYPDAAAADAEVMALDVLATAGSTK